MTIIVTRPEETYIIQEILQDYENATGARINTHKSCAIALGFCNTSTPIMDINYHDEIKLLRFNMMTNIKESAAKSWAALTAKIRA